MSSGEDRRGPATRTWRSRGCHRHHRRCPSRGPRNAAALLGVRGRGLGPVEPRALNMKLLRELLCQESTVFKKMGTIHSTTPIAYEEGRIYTENYKHCYTSNGVVPKLLYQLPKCPAAEKMEDALLCESPVCNVLPKASDYFPSLMALRADGWLLRLDANTSQLLEKVYLSPVIKFRHLSWSSNQEVFAVKSIQNKLLPKLGQTNSPIQPPLLHMAVFTAFPLSLVGMLAVERKIFENNISDATVSQGFLITMHSDGHVKLFNLEEIVKKYRLKDLSLGQACEWNKTCVVGAKPFGIPCNIDIKACPTVLFTVKCLENQLHIGGFPWHYIISLNQRKQKGKFRVFSLANESPSLNSVLDMQSVALESDWILFHPDDSGRILHVGPRQIDVLCIKTNELPQGLCHRIEKQFTIDTKEDDQNEPEVFVTSSGRVVKKRFLRFDDDPERETVHVVDHREEVDLLVVTCVRPGDAGSMVTVKFHDNYNGRLIKSVPLSEPWDVTYDQSLCLHADTIVQITQNHNRSYSCHVHKMFNTEVLEEEERERKEREGRKRKKSTRERKEPRP
ncbi:unnamed protein product [Lampetra fluviatilis]